MAGEPSTARSVWLWVVATFWTLVYLPAAILLSVASHDRAYTLTRAWARRELSVFGIELETVDRGNSRPAPRPALYVLLNQTSLTEAWLLFQVGPGPLRFVMNIEYFLIPLVGWVLWFMGGAIVVRQWHWQAKLAIAKAVRGLRAGQNWGISIEGRRSPDGSLQPYKKGPAWMAIQTGATIVPFFLEGSRERWPPGSWRVRPGRVRLTLCEPIPTASLTLADRGRVVQQLQEIANRELGGAAPTVDYREGAGEGGPGGEAHAGGEGDAA